MAAGGGNLRYENSTSRDCYGSAVIWHVRDAAYDEIAFFRETNTTYIYGVGQYIHRKNAYWIASKNEIFHSHRTNKRGRLFLHSVFQKINQRREQIGVENRPNGFQDRVEPLCAFACALWALLNTSREPADVNEGVMVITKTSNLLLLMLSEYEPNLLLQPAGNLLCQKIFFESVITTPGKQDEWDWQGRD